MNRISGRVDHLESGRGIPDILVAIYDLDPDTRPEEQIPTGPGALDPIIPQADCLATLATGPDGSFTFTYDDAEFRVRNPTEKRPDLWLMILAPEQPGRSLADRTLYTSTSVRRDAGLIEEFRIRLSSDQLTKAGITPPSIGVEQSESASSVLGRLKDLEARQGILSKGGIDLARLRVETRRAQFNGFQAAVKPALVAELSRMPKAVQDPDRFVALGESPFEKCQATIRKGIVEAINSDDPRRRTPVRGFLSLTEAELAELKAQAGPDGTVPDEAVATIAARNGQTARTTYVQAADRLPLCRPSTPETARADSILDPRPPLGGGSGPPPVEPTPIDALSADDLPRFLGRLVNTLTSPEEQLLTGLMPVATRDSVQSSVRDLLFPPSPADVPAFHDRTSLQIAFEHVWQEAIDQGVIDLAQDAYETIVELGGDPHRDDLVASGPLRAIVSEGRTTLKTSRSRPAVVDHRNGQPGGNPYPTPPAGYTPPDSGHACNPPPRVVPDHRSGSSPIAVRNGDFANADPADRLPALLQELERQLVQNYSFTVYAANGKERSVNFGILNTFRQTWTPLSYQAGPLVKSIPLAPEQEQRVVVTRKTTKQRSRREEEKNLRVTKDDTSTTDRAEQEIVRRSSLKNTSTETSSVQQDVTTPKVVGSATGSASSSTSDTTTRSTEAAKSTDDTKRSFRESVVRTSQEVRREKVTVVTAEETETYEATETTVIRNSNKEIAVTYLFYELQRRYRLYERLYRVQPVVLVAQEFPQPHEINQAWLLTHDWILKRVILDDSFLPTLEYLCGVAGEESALAEMEFNVSQQRCIVDQLREEVAIARRRADLQEGLIERSVFKKAGAGGITGLIGGVLDSALSAAGQVAGDIVDKVGGLVIGDDPAANSTNRDTMQDRAQAAADEARDLMFRLEREVTALNALTETYTKALREFHAHLTEIARLECHVKQNIFHYMQAVWSHEPPDQRFFRLHNVPVPLFEAVSRRFRVDFENPLPTVMAEPHGGLPRFGGRDARTYRFEALTRLKDELRFVPLSQVADIDNLLGYKGNYMIFPLLESNLLTDFMMDPYVDRATGQLVDPSDPVDWSIDEFSAYVCCLRDQLTPEEFETLLPQLKEQHRAILSAARRNDDVIVVPTNSLFIEALPAEHSLIEKYMRDHRMLDVKKVQAEVREKEIENLRRAARILAGQLQDPDIDKVVQIEGNGQVLVPPGDA